MKRCIFHYPEPVADNPTAGSALRPNRMLHALRSIGYEVEEVTGYSSERRKKIDQIRQQIQNGMQYDFVYSENINSPTLLADQDHIPRHPWMDFQFFRFCKAHQIPVLLFYRDIYWKFPDIFNGVASFWKRSVLIPLFRYDLRKYRSCLDLMFLPTERMHTYVDLELPYKPLPPGGDLRTEILSRRKNRADRPDSSLHLFYVGSISALYDNRKLVQAVSETPDVYLTLCTHKNQWAACKALYEPYLCDRIQIVHKSGAELAECYEDADIAAYCLNDHAYLDMAMPIKLFEAISYGTPLLTTSVESIADFVRREQIGWVAETSVEGIRKQLEFLKTHPADIREKTNLTVEAAHRHTWESRARQVAAEAKLIDRRNAL